MVPSAGVIIVKGARKLLRAYSGVRPLIAPLKDA